MHQKMLYLWLAVFMAAFFMNGCGQEPTGAFNNEVLSVQQPPAIGGKSGEATVDAYPQRCFSLNVPFIKQADPPGEWANTKNCGQACAVMLAGYFNRAAVTPARITAQNTWLANYTHDQRYNQANGWYTGGNAQGAFIALLRQYNSLNVSVCQGNSPEDVVNQAANGHPCIVGVMISNGRLVSRGGIAHWALVVGWDGNIFLNDPGTSRGNHISYSVAAFDASWATSGRIYIPVSR